MNLGDCGREPAVLAASRSGAWSPEVVAHARICSQCADIMLVAEFLRRESETAQAEPGLPSAGFLWWKSRLQARRRNAQHATRPIELVRNVALIIRGTGLVWWVATMGPAREWVSQALKNELHLPALWPSGLGAISLISLGGAIVCALLASLYMATIDQ